MYSITSRSTFDLLEQHRLSIQRVRSVDPIFVLAGNKCDNSYEREVTKEEGAALAHQFGCQFVETSAKTGQNVELMFSHLVRALRQKMDPPAARTKKPKKLKCIVL